MIFFFSNFKNFSHFLSNLNFVLLCFHNEIVFPQNATIVQLQCTHQKNTPSTTKRKKGTSNYKFRQNNLFKKSLHTVENLLVKWCGMIKFFTCPKKFEKCIEAACFLTLVDKRRRQKFKMRGNIWVERKLIILHFCCCCHLF